MILNVKRTFWQLSLDPIVSNHRLVLTLIFLGLPCWLPAQTLLHRYSFVSTANDSVGTANGTLVAPHSGKAAATISNGLSLPGTGTTGTPSGYVKLPNNLLSGDTNITVECWVTQNSARTWAEIWSFGVSGGSVNFALIPASPTPNMEVAFSPSGYSDIYVGNSSTPALPSGSEIYTVVTYDNSTLIGSLYTNGVLDATTTYASSVYSPGTYTTTEDYLGSDPYSSDAQFSGTIYELRIWNGVVSPLYLAASTMAGSSVLITNLTPASVSVAVVTSMVGSGTQQATVTANLPQLGTTNVPATSSATWTSGNTSVLTVNNNGLITAVSGGTTTVSATVNGINGTSSNITVSLTAPMIIAQPTSQTLGLGNTAVFTVVAVGGQLTYQWSYGASPINGATNATLTLPGISANNAGSYSVLVTNPIGNTNSIAVTLTINAPEIYVNAGQSLHQISTYLTGACLEDVNHEVYGGIYSQMIFGESFQEPATNGTFGAVSGMWIPISTGTVTGRCSLETTNPFVGSQSQVITFTNGTGAVGIANQGLNHWGMSIVGGNSYTGCVDVLAAVPTVVWVALESADGSTVYAQQSLFVTSNNWQHLNFTLTPSASASGGRFSIKLEQTGSVTVGYAFLEPSAWGCFQGLPVRNDVAEGLINQGITVLRYGGSMVNASGYRWKNMTGPRDQRPPYTGTWYPYSSDGWGIPDFLNLCEAAGFLAVPDFNINETPQDMADFMEYANGPTNSVWGAQRMADGHPQPYGLKYLELGNEEAVNASYFQKFQPLTEAIWVADPNITIVVGDFEYTQSITNPYNFGGADSGITTLAAQQQILQLAEKYNRAVWFDVHVQDEGPTPSSALAGMLSYDSALGRIAPGANYKVVVFEFNAENHTQSRALANALCINAIERDGRLPIACSANCLQPDGQNNNGWDQGLLFLNQSNVWLQPPGYVTQMYSQSYQPIEVWSSVADPNSDLDVSAECNTNGSILVLKVVNLNGSPETAVINLAAFVPTNPVAMVEEFTGALAAVNTAANTTNLVPMNLNWQAGFTNMTANFTFASNSVTTITIQGGLTPTPPPVLNHRYSFDGAAGGTAIADSVGNQNGTFYGSSGGLDGNGYLVLNGTNGFVDLGPNLVAGYTNVTIEAWGVYNINYANNAHLFDFGNTDQIKGSDAYGMDFCPHAGANSWFEVFNTDPGGNGNAQQILGPSLAGGAQMQVAVVYDPQMPYVTVYTNGVLESSGLISIPFSALVDSHDYIGKSGNNSDPYLSATVKEFRVYSGDMSDAQVAVDYAAGPDTLVTNAGSLTNLNLVVPTLVYSGQTLQATVTGDFNNIQGVNLSFGNLTVQSGNPGIIQAGQNLTLTAVNAGTTTVTVSYGGLTAFQPVTVVGLPATLSHRYGFNEPAGSTTFTDLVGSANGTVNGTAHLDGSGRLVLPGGISPNNNNYGALPANLITGYTAVTFECWVAFGTNSAWGRLVDFGYTDTNTGNGAYCIDFTPHSGNNPNGFNFEVADTDPGFNDAQAAALQPVLDNRGELQLVLVYDPGQYLLVYTNGVLMGQNTNVTIPMSAIVNAHSYLGKSSYSSDPNGVATLDEFRIYNGVLTPLQVATDYVAGPNTLPTTGSPTLSISISGNSLILNWPANAVGYNIQTTATLGTGESWGSPPGAPAPVLTNGVYQVALPVGSQTAFYRLAE